MNFGSGERFGLQVKFPLTHNRTHTRTAGVSVDDGVEGDGGVKSDSGGEEDEVDMRAYRPAGGPILLQLLEMPPPPKMTNNWTIRRGMTLSLQLFVFLSVLLSVLLSVCPLVCPVHCSLYPTIFQSVCLFRSDSIVNSSPHDSSSFLPPCWLVTNMAML